MRWLMPVLPLLASGAAYGQQPARLRVGSLDVSVAWRTRAEVWDWFTSPTGNSSYRFWHSLLRAGVGQTRPRVDWFIEGEQPTILGLPDDAVAAAPQGQLGLGGTYYVANRNHRNNAGLFLKQAFITIKGLGPASVKLGRFEYFDGLETRPSDPTLAAQVSGRVAHRLISNFGFTAVQRTFDGGQVALNGGHDNLTLFAGRPTAGIFQVDGMDEVRVDAYYAAYTRAIPAGSGGGVFRLFGLGYIDHRNTVLKTDNRAAGVRAGDLAEVRIATWGASYAHVVSTQTAGKFTLVLWGVLQRGSWGALSQRSSAYVGEIGWQPAIPTLKPAISLGYSCGSGDGDPNDARHGTFFQVLTTPRQYARFPFYNMMNNRDAYATLNLRPTPKLALRTEAHALSLASAADLWYSGGGVFQPATFGYSGRPSGGASRLAHVWDGSADYSVAAHVTVSLYYAHAWGGPVVASIYPTGKNAQFLYLETLVRF